MLRHGLAVDVATRLDLGGDLRRYVLGPVLQRVVGDHPDRIVELPRQQLADRGLEIGALEFGFAIDRVPRAKTVDHEIDGLICAKRHDVRYFADWHTHLPHADQCRPPRAGSNFTTIFLAREILLRST